MVHHARALAAILFVILVASLPYSHTLATNRAQTQTDLTDDEVVNMARTKGKQKPKVKSGHSRSSRDADSEASVEDDMEEVKRLQKQLEELQKQGDSDKGRRRGSQGSRGPPSPGRHPDDEIRCPDHLWQCGSKECILPSYKCDDHNDCSDGSDEAGCPDVSSPLWKCPRNLYTCANKECILQMYRCNGRGECSDGSDEWNCSESPGDATGTGAFGKEKEKVENMEKTAKKKTKKQKKIKKKAKNEKEEL